MLINSLLAPLRVRLIRTATYDRLLRTADYELTALWNRRFVPDVFGHRMYANPDDLGLPLWPLKGAPLQEQGDEIRALQRHLRPGQVAVDVGANVGLLTLLLARQVGPGGRVIAFEPGPLAFGLLSANIAINSDRNVEAVRAAVMDYSGWVELHLYCSGDSNNRVAGVAMTGPSREIIWVPCVTLDQHFATGARVDFIKIDVQGAEQFALKGMRRVLDQNRDIVVMLEYAPAALLNAGTAPSDYLAYLRSMGFSLHNLPDDGDERLVKWLLMHIGASGQRQQTNLLLRR